MDQARASQLIRGVSRDEDTRRTGGKRTFMLSFSNNAFSVFRKTSIRSMQNPRAPARLE